jgi:lipoic acid synthetase
MLGLGEKKEEVMETLTELKRKGCQYLTIGQYLRPSKDHLPVARFVPPREFQDWAEKARSMGFKAVAAGPLVRSSYRAHEMFDSEALRSKERGILAYFRKQEISLAV